MFNLKNCENIMLFFPRWASNSCYGDTETTPPAMCPSVLTPRPSILNDYLAFGVALCFIFPHQLNLRLKHST